MTAANLPALITWLFYLGNLLLIAAYLVVVLLMLRPGGITGRGQASPTMTAVIVLFFASCALLHLELAIQAAEATPHALVVDSHLTGVVWLKVILVVWGAIATHRIRAANLDREAAEVDAAQAALPGPRPMHATILLHRHGDHVVHDDDDLLRVEPPAVVSPVAEPPPAAGEEDPGGKTGG